MQFRLSKLHSTTPRRPQDGLEELFFRHRLCLRFWSAFSPVLAPSCPLLGTPDARKIDPKSNQKSYVVARCPPRSLPDRPKTAQDPPKTPPGLPRMPSRLPKMPTPKSFPGHSSTVQRVENFEIDQKMSKNKSTMFTHGCRSTQSIANIESHSQRSNPRGWRRWSRGELFDD